jgi:hypothetical protein
MSASLNSASLHRPFACDECSKVFTRSVSATPYLLHSILIRNPPQENLQRHKRTRKACNLLQIFSIISTLIFAKVIVALDVRIFNVLRVRLDFLEGLGYLLHMTYFTSLLIVL